MSERWRRLGSVAMLAAGLIALLGAILTLYVDDRILDDEQFADSAVATLEDPAVDRFVARQITVQVIDRLDPDLVSFKPLIESAVGSLLGSDALRAALRQGVIAAHRTVFDRELDTAEVDLENVGALIAPVLARLEPRLAGEVPRRLDVGVANVADQPLVVDAAQAATKVERWAGVLPGLAILLIGGSVVLAPGRRRAAIRAGLSIVALAAGSIVALEVARAALLERVDAADRDAAAAVWDEFLDGLVGWELAVAGLGVVLATAAAALLRTFDIHEPLRRAWQRVAAEPAGGLHQALRALGLAAAGLLMVLAPERVLEALVVVLGVYLIALGVSTAVGALARRRGWSLERLEAASGAAQARDPVNARRVLVGGLAAVAFFALAVGVSLSALLRDDRGGPATAERTGRCNGAALLCDRRLDEVAFLATHNSYAGTGYPGFLFPEQEGTIPSQLAAGVRGLWIDTYYGVPGRRVYTRTDRIDPALNAQLGQELGPRFVDAASRVRARIARPPQDAPQRIYLCHGYCELGAVEAGHAFRAIRSFLERNPEEVLIIDLEDYTTPADTVALLRRTGLADLVYKGAVAPLPSLGEMIRRGEPVLLLVEHDTAGAPAWYRPAYRDLLQETPFQFKAPAQMGCGPNRGRPSNPLFLINNWIDTDPTPKPSNAAVVNAYRFLLDRARRCEKRRGLFPNFLNVDFFGQGDAAAVVATLNGTGG
jgi:uncharacterized membrane protein HdeD (DUF308 family)